MISDPAAYQCDLFRNKCGSNFYRVSQKMGVENQQHENHLPDGAENESSYTFSKLSLSSSKNASEKIQLSLMHMAASLGLTR